MEVFKLKDIQLLQKKHTHLFIYFYDDWCHKITDALDLFFKTKYDLNKVYIKVHIKHSKSIINKLNVTSFPVIHIYTFSKLVSIFNCNCQNMIDKINIVYNNI